MGLLVPQKVSRGIVTKLHAETVRIISLPDVKQRIIADASEPVGSTPQEFSAHIKREIARWTKVGKAANIKLD
jgi:tripartite-type tricarboxylate transporter receptor subunit TctC